MNTHDHDNDELPGDDELTSLYRSLPRKEPAPALDSAIRRAAAEAVRPRHTIPRWPVAVASVAVIVVAGALGWRVAQQPTATPRTSASSVVAQQALPAPAAPPAMPSLAEAPAPVAATSETRHDNIRTAMKAKVMAPAVASRQAPVAVAESAPTVAMNNAAPPALVAPAAPVASVAPAAESLAPQADRLSRAAAAPPMAMKATALSTAAAPPRDATAPNAADTPDQELAKIRELFALQRHDEAAQRLAAFRKAHPDIPLPDDLRAQLPDHE